MPRNNPIPAPAITMIETPANTYNSHSVNPFMLTPNINLLRTEYLSLVNQINELFGSEL